MRKQYVDQAIVLTSQVLDPQAALMTTAEVHQFLSSNPPRPKQNKIGTYKPVDLNNYTVVRDDVGDRFSFDQTIYTRC